MVEVRKKLIEILELRKGDFTGEDIKHVVESILLCTTVEVDPKAMKPEEILKQWMGE
jgi:hypothetical protein